MNGHLDCVVNGVNGVVAARGKLPQDIANNNNNNNNSKAVAVNGQKTGEIYGRDFFRNLGKSHKPFYNFVTFFAKRDLYV